MKPLLQGRGILGEAGASWSPLPGREGLGVGAEALGGFLEDRLGYALGIDCDVRVPEADDGPAFGLEEARAGLVARRIDVLAAVDLDDQLRLAAGEIGYERTDR